MHAGVARPCSVPSWRLSSHEATITPEPDKSLTFYLDNRSPNAPIFSTIVHFHAGDNATVFGVNATNFSVLELDNQGAKGYTGLDIIFSAPGHTATSFVLAGYSTADLSAGGRLSMSYGKTPDLPNLPGSEYLGVHAN